MIILSEALTVGQATFIVRVAIQILSYGGVFLLGMILLGNAPRVGNADTHALINRIVGASTQTKETALWLLSRLRGRANDPSPTKTITVVFALFLLYHAFVSFSDLGFLGFVSCSVPGSNYFTHPASVNSTQDALNLITLNMINGTDPSTVGFHRCNSAQTIQPGPNITAEQCTSWINSTYSDGSLFSSLNTTDSDVLMPRLIYTHNDSRSAFFDLNNYYLGPSSQRVTQTTVQNGIAVDPRDDGLTVLINVPNIDTSSEVILDRTLALELEVGCMTVGVYTQHDLGADGIGLDVMRLNGTWRQYLGPDYMEDILANYTDQIRAYYQQFFDLSTVASDGYVYNNGTSFLLSIAANIGPWTLPTKSLNDTGPQAAILGNCTADLQHKLGVSSPYYGTANQGNMCTLMGAGGMLDVPGIAADGFSRMICATSTQVNMVSAKVARDALNSVTVSTTRLPSDLHYLYADYWDVAPSPLDPNTTVYTTFDPVERFTLSPNPNSPTSHYIPHRGIVGFGTTVGPGSAGCIISALGSAAIYMDVGTVNLDYAGIRLLGEGYDAVNFNNTPVLGTRWISEVGASIVQQSIGYNGWAALDVAPIEVISTGGRIGTCYKPAFLIGFLPLLLAACVVTGWAFSMMFSRSLFGTKTLEKRYGGVKPYLDAMHPGSSSPDTILVWEAAPSPHLQIVSKGAPIMGDANGTASKYIKSGRMYNPS